MKNVLWTHWKKVLVMTCLIIFYSSLFLSHGRERQLHSIESGNEPGYESVSKSEILRREAIFKERIAQRPKVVGIFALCVFEVLFFGIMINVYLLSRKLDAKPLIDQGPAQPNPLWGLGDVLNLFILLLSVEMVFYFIGLASALFVGPQNLDRYMIMMTTTLVRDVLAAAFVIVVVVKQYGQRLSALGLTSAHWLKNILIGVLGYIALAPLILIVLIFLAFVLQVFAYEPPVQPVVQAYLFEPMEARLLFFTFLVAILGPVIEEIFFRGFTYRAFRQRFGIWPALFISSGIFSILHMTLAGFIPIFILAFILAYLYERTGSLVPSMTAHVIHNIIMVFFTLGFKGLSA